MILRHNYRIYGKEDINGVTRWSLQERTFIFFWRTIYKETSIEDCFAELHRRVSLG